MVNLSRQSSTVSESDQGLLTVLSGVGKSVRDWIVRWWLPLTQHGADVIRYTPGERPGGESRSSSIVTSEWCTVAPYIPQISVVRTQAKTYI